jgi:DNA modification methylase
MTGGEHKRTPGERKYQRPDGCKPKDLIGIPWMLAFALRADGWFLRQEIIWHKPNPMPESVTDRCTKSHEQIFLLAKSPTYYFDAEAMKEPSVTNDPRRPYTSKGAKDLDGRSEWKSGQARDKGDFSLRNKRSVWTVTTKPFKGAHFATYPEELVEPMVLAGCPPGGIVLDQFFGSGTTGAVAQRLGRQWIGCELNTAYKPLQDERLRQPSLLLEAA